MVVAKTVLLLTQQVAFGKIIVKSSYKVINKSYKIKTKVIKSKQKL